MFARRCCTKNLVLATALGLCSFSPTLSGQTNQIYSYSVPSGGYAPNGNVAAVSDSANGQWTNLQYDSLNRLISGTLNRAMQATQYYCWAYDSFGNRTVQQLSDQPFQTASGANCQAAGTLIANVITTPDSSNRIQSTNAGGVTMAPTYDGSGNMTFDGRNYMAYDGESRVCAVLSVNGGLTQYLYNADGQRVAKGHSASTNALACPQYRDFVADEKYVLGQNGEQVTQLNQVNGSDQWHHSNVWSNGQLLATYDLQGLHFNIADPLGTKRVQASATGVSELTYASLPYGDGATTDGSGTDATEHHFTGKERDQETGFASGNDYFGARYYASSMGRWMSPDWSAKAEPVPYAKLENPQTLNLYGYVGNNPLSRTDPSGHYECGGTKSQCATIRKALSAIQKASNALEKGSAGQKQLQGILKTYGAEGQKNGVNVAFGSLGGSAYAQTVTEGKTTTVTFDLKQINADASKGNFGTEAAVTTGHEGAHVVDQKANGMTSSFQGIEQSERNAYTAESYIYQGLGKESADYVWSRSWAPANVETLRYIGIISNAESNAIADCAGGGCTKP